MKVKLKELLIPQPKSKVKAGEGLIDGKDVYKRQPSDRLPQLKRVV